MPDQTRILPLLDSGCGCGPTRNHGDHHGSQVSLNSTASQSYRLVGLTCGQCVASVTKEIEGIPGITAVEIDLIPGGESRLTLSSDHRPAREQIAVAVTEAGYQLVDEDTA
jgi:copper chaperone